MTTTVRGGAARHRIRIEGVVQGVGFRPFVHRLAVELDLAGSVRNDSRGVIVDVEGPEEDLDAFTARLQMDAPPLAVIRAIGVDSGEPVGDTGFRILESTSCEGTRTYVAPDVAVCDDCVAELEDPMDRRFRYPFINCTNCGPRFTITRRLPYDRPNTTMNGFAMCSHCRDEYEDPLDRRFHAQPIACAACGPRVRFEWSGETGSTRGSDEAISAALDALSEGAIVAVKGIGGYHLACDAINDHAVNELRRRKARGDKPFAVMVRDSTALGSLGWLGPVESRQLSSWQRPIVILGRPQDCTLSASVAPGNPNIGVLLPYSPLHHLLFRPVPGTSAAVPDALVMTSGNLSDEPICFDDHDARKRLGRIADAWLVHDRPIHVPCDDSVVRVDGVEVIPIRRSRGFAPTPVLLEFEAPEALATGGELKNTFCVASGHDAWISQHIGDMGSTETLSAFERSVDQFGEIYGVHPGQVVADAHPAYQTRLWAEDRSERVELVQHHHAHIASVMAENGLRLGESVIGFAFDGTGYGDDGTIWGGEVLHARYDGFERVAHLESVQLTGGDATIRRPYRAALCFLRDAGIPWAPQLAPVAFASDEELGVIDRQLERGFGCIGCSSMGRLFDSVSSLLGIRHTASYEGQAAIELEMAASAAGGTAPRYRFDIEGESISARTLLTEIVRDLEAGTPRGVVAFGFHEAVAAMIGAVAEEKCRAIGAARVALSGGVFQNALLLRLSRRELGARGITVLTHTLLPPNDGGLALGQVAVASAREAMKVAKR